METIIIIIAILLFLGIVSTAIVLCVNYIRKSRLPLPTEDPAEEKTLWRLELRSVPRGTYMTALFHGSLVIGRGEPELSGNSRFFVGRGQTISREQCIVYERTNTLYIWNLSKTNQTYLNGQRLESPTELQNGDRIRAGEETFVVTSIQAQ